MDVGTEVNVTELWEKWFAAGVILGTVNLLVRISSFWPWFCTETGEDAKDPSDTKIFTMLIPRCVIGILLTIWIVYGTVYRFNSMGQIAANTLEETGQVIKIGLIAMYIIYVVPYLLFCCLFTCGSLLWFNFLKHL